MRFNLCVHPLRPGLAHECVELTLDAQLGPAIEKAARDDGVPPALWVAIAIESERVLMAAAQATRTSRDCVEAALNGAASEPESIAIALRGRRLGGYARALRQTSASGPAATLKRLQVMVAYHTLVAWELEAAQQGLPVTIWASTLLGRMPKGRLMWEAAAAETGQTLAEWTAFQAARRASC